MYTYITNAKHPGCVGSVGSDGICTQCFRDYSGDEYTAGDKCYSDDCPCDDDDTPDINF